MTIVDKEQGDKRKEDQETGYKELREKMTSSLGNKGQEDKEKR